MPQFDTTFFTGQIFWMLLSFGFLYLMMSSLICPMIEEVLSDRQHRIDTYLAEAQTLNQQAESFHQRLQVYHLQTEKETNERLQEAYSRLQREALKLEKRNDQMLRLQVNRIENKIALKQHTFTQETNPLIRKMADHLVQKLTGEK